MLLELQTTSSSLWAIPTYLCSSLRPGLLCYNVGSLETAEDLHVTTDISDMWWWLTEWPRGEFILLWAWLVWELPGEQGTPTPNHPLTPLLIRSQGPRKTFASW